MEVEETMMLGALPRTLDSDSDLHHLLPIFLVSIWTL